MKKRVAIKDDRLLFPLIYKQNKGILLKFRYKRILLKYREKIGQGNLNSRSLSVVCFSSAGGNFL